MLFFRICVFAAVGTADALRATRRQCCNFVAATAALAADKACAVDSNALEDAFSARTKVLRSVPCGNQPPCVGCTVPSSRRRIDGVEDEAAIQHERSVKF